MRNRPVNSPAGRRPSGRSRRLVFEPCERRDLLSGAGVGGDSLDAWQQAAACVPSITYEQLTGDIVIAGDWFDTGGQNDSSKPLLTLVYDADGAASFVLTSAVRDFQLNAYTQGTVAGLGEDYATDDSGQGLEKLLHVLPEKELPVFPTSGGGEAAGTHVAETVNSMSLRVAMAGLSEPGSGVALSSADGPRQVAELNDPGATRLSPAERVRLHQGVWDRAWAFEMSGFSRPATPSGSQEAGEPHFESAFLEFPAEAPRRLDAAVTPVVGARQASTPNEETTGVARTLPTPSADERLARRSEPARVTFAPQAIDEAIAADEVELQLPPTWLGAVVERNHELGAMALAAVVARQAWLHAKPETEKRHSPHRVWPRRK